MKTIKIYFCVSANTQASWHMSTQTNIEKDKKGANIYKCTNIIQINKQNP